MLSIHSLRGKNNAWSFGTAGHLISEVGIGVLKLGIILGLTNS